MKTGKLEPGNNEVPDIGAAGNAYNRLYVKQGTIYFGTHVLSVSGSGVLQLDGVDVNTGSTSIAIDILGLFHNDSDND